MDASVETRKSAAGLLTLTKSCLKAPGQTFASLKAGTISAPPFAILAGAVVFYGVSLGVVYFVHKFVALVPLSRAGFADSLVLTFWSLLFALRLFYFPVILYALAGVLGGEGDLSSGAVGSAAITSAMLPFYVVVGFAAAGSLIRFGVCMGAIHVWDLWMQLRMAQALYGLGRGRGVMAVAGTWIILDLTLAASVLSLFPTLRL